MSSLEIWLIITLSELYSWSLNSSIESPPPWRCWQKAFVLKLVSFDVFEVELKCAFFIIIYWHCHQEEIGDSSEQGIWVCHWDNFWHVKTLEKRVFVPPHAEPNDTWVEAWEWDVNGGLLHASWNFKYRLPRRLRPSPCVVCEVELESPSILGSNVNDKPVISRHIYEHWHAVELLPVILWVVGSSDVTEATADTARGSVELSVATFILDIRVRLATHNSVISGEPLFLKFSWGWWHGVHR